MNDLLVFMFKHYGIKEVIGAKHNPAILEMFKEIGFPEIKDDETSWCSAAMNYFCFKCGYERSGKLTARSWLGVGEKIEDFEFGNPDFVDIVVFWRGTIDGWMGHVAVPVTKDKENVFCLGGNQGDQFCISPYPIKRVLGYRRIKKIVEEKELNINLNTR